MRGDLRSRVGGYEEDLYERCGTDGVFLASIMRNLRERVRGEGEWLAREL